MYLIRAIIFSSNTLILKFYLVQVLHMHMYQVDAFTDKPFTGNPAAVLILNNWPSNALMQAIAFENNLPETAYAKSRSDGAWDLRWFSPTQEVDFCGHATLATAHILFTTRDIQTDIIFHTKVGKLIVSKTEQGYRLSIPRLEPELVEQAPNEVAELFSSISITVFRDIFNYYIDIGSSQAVRDFVPNMTIIERLGQIGLVITGVCLPEEQGDFVSRSFAPGVGIPEDPVTGSTHATLVPYWAEKLGRCKLLAYQASKRGGWLNCELSSDQVMLEGKAVTFMEANIFLDNRV